MASGGWEAQEGQWCQRLKKGQSQDQKAPLELGSQGPPCLWWISWHSEVRKAESEWEEALGCEGKETDEVSFEVQGDIVLPPFIKQQRQMNTLSGSGEGDGYESLRIREGG